MIYADNAATTRTDPAALEAMMPWLTQEYGNPSQLYSFARGPRQALAQARETIARCIHALPEEICFTSGGTESDNWAVKGAALSGPGRGGIITSAIEHHAVLRSCEAAARLGVPVTCLPPDADGVVSPDVLQRSFADGTRLVSVMLANNELGTIQPVKQLCAVAHARGAWFHTDAVQAVGHIEVDVQALGVDMLSASAHKFNGPKGAGFLYLRSGAGLAPYADGGAQEHGRRAGTENVAAIVGMAAALKANCGAMQQNRAHLRALEARLLGRLDAAGVRYTRNGGRDTLPGLLSLSFAGQDGEAILRRLDLADICVSTGSACDSVNPEVSHVLKAIGLERAQALGTIRISFGKYNTADEADRIAAELVRIAGSRF